MDENEPIISSLKQNARFFLSMNGEKLEVRHNSNFLANLIVVIDEAKHALLCEIGISRTRPYKKIRSSKNGQNFFLGRRQKDRDISRGEFIILWPEIEKILIYLSVKQRAKWQSGANWFLDRKVFYPRGIHASVRADDKLLFEQIIAEDFEYRKWKYLARYVQVIRFWTSGYKLCRYSSKMLKRLRRLHKALDLWSNSRISDRDRLYIFDQLSQQQRNLLAFALNESGLAVPPENQEKLCGKGAKSFIHSTKASFYVRPKERKGCSRNFLVFEVLPL